MKKGCIFLLIAALLFGGSAFAAEESGASRYTVVVRGGSLHIRKTPETDGKVAGTYKSGTELELLENNGVWCRVRKGSKTAYAMTQYLSFKGDYAHLGWGKTPNDGSVINLRAAADKNSAVVGKSMSGVTLEVIEESGDYYKARMGSVFGYVEKGKITLRADEAEYALNLTAADSVTVDAQSLTTATREVGSARTLSKDDGAFTYTIAMPQLGIPAADDAINTWVKETRNLFYSDAKANHPDAQANMNVQYQALAIDSRYQSVLMIADYQVDGLSCQRVLTLNVDTAEGKIIRGAALFSAADRALFSIEARVGDILGRAADGYDGKPDESWLDGALLTNAGVEIYLPAGLYLPHSLGLRKISLSYGEMAEKLALDSELIRGYARVIDPTRPMIALTFDDGPSEETARILDVLEKYNQRATFCVVGTRIGQYGDMIKRAIAQGNEIATHTWSHKKLTELSASGVRQQITSTLDAVRELTGGYEIKVMRPPYGSTNKTVRSVCAELGLVIAHWELDTLDWSTRSANKTYRKIIRQAENGTIVLCHDLYESTATAIERAVPELVEKGYQLVTVSELLSFHKDGAQPGTVYSHLDPKNIKTE